MRVSSQMIHPELRRSGKLFKLILRYKNADTFRLFRRGTTFISKFFKAKGVDYSSRFIQTPDNPHLRICIFQACEKKPDAVGLLWIHGGGYAIGTPEEEYPYIQNLMNAANCVVISPDYRLSVDAPYPAAINDCYQALLWMKDHAAELGIRSDQLFVAGESAGGGLTAAVSLMARSRGEVKIAFQMPLYPMLDDRMTSESARDNDAPVWDSHANLLAWQLYLGELFGTADVPAFAAPSRELDYAGLPPTYTFVGDIEPFFDETRKYIADLKQAGVPAEIDIYPGCFHAFDLMCPKTSVAQEAVKKYCEKFRYAAEHYLSPQPKV